MNLKSDILIPPILLLCNNIIFFSYFFGISKKLIFFSFGKFTFFLTKLRFWSNDFYYKLVPIEIILRIFYGFQLLFWFSSHLIILENEIFIWGTWNDIRIYYNFNLFIFFRFIISSFRGFWLYFRCWMEKYCIVFPRIPLSIKTQYHITTTLQKQNIFVKEIFYSVVQHWYVVARNLSAIS